MNLCEKPSILIAEDTYDVRGYKKLIKVEVYTSTYCPYCHAAKGLLSRKGVEFEEIDLSTNHELRIELVEKHKWRTVPIILINDELIGGYEELADLERKGELDGLLSIEVQE